MKLILGVRAEVLQEKTGAVGQEQIDNLPITVTNQLLPGSEDIFFSYLSIEITEATVGEYKCENGKETNKNFVNIEMRTGKAIRSMSDELHEMRHVRMSRNLELLVSLVHLQQVL